MMTHLAQSWIAAAHLILGTDPLQHAIQLYQAQKAAFIQQLNTTGELAEEDFVNQLNVEMANQLHDEADNGGMYGIAKEIFEATQAEVEKIIDGLSSNEKANWQAEINATQGRFKKTKDTHKEVKDTAENLRESMHNNLFGGEEGINDFLTNIGTKLGRQVNLQSSDITGQILGYARRWAVVKLSSKYNVNANNVDQFQKDLHMQRYATTTKGYITEQWWSNIINDILRPYQAKLTAGQTVGASKAGSESKIDILIGTYGAEITSNHFAMFDNILGQMDAELQSNASLLWEEIPVKFKKGYFGVQSKSWTMKDLNNIANNNVSRVSFGSVSSLIPEGTAAYIWHAGLVRVMNNIPSVIGPNVLFATGSHIQWTADLLAKIREQNYILAFRLSTRSGEHEGKIISGEVYALPHNDSAARYTKTKK